MTKRGRLIALITVMIGAGLGIASIFLDFALVMGVYAVVAVLWYVAVVTFMIRRSRPGKPAPTTPGHDGPIHAQPAPTPPPRVDQPSGLASNVSPTDPSQP